MWSDISTCPEGRLVMTKIDDAQGCRNVQPLVRRGSLFFADSMYVYYSPTHWRELTEIETRRSRMQAEQRVIKAFESVERILNAKD